jgi:hypothetical protein
MGYPDTGQAGTLDDVSAERSYRQPGAGRELT